MSSVSLSTVKRRIKSVESTMKITNAMSMVANSKYARCKSNLYLNKEYMKNIQSVVGRIMPWEGYRQFTASVDSDKKLYVLFSSDVGLCGSYNSGLFKRLQMEIDNKSRFLVCGMKGRDFIYNIGGETIAEYVEMPVFTSIKEARIIANKLLNFLVEEKYEAYGVYYKFNSALKKDLILEKIFPIEFQDEKSLEGDESQSVYDIISFYLSSKILNMMMESKTSELSFRIQTTNNAIKNGKDMLRDLKKMYNRIRQSNITNEISEIVGGVEASK